MKSCYQLIITISISEKTNTPTPLQQAYEKRPPIKITETKRNATKRTTSDKEEYTIIKSAKITPTTLEFALDESYVSNLLTVADALNANVCQTVALKVKIVTKGENKQVKICLAFRRWIFSSCHGGRFDEFAIKHPTDS